MRLPAVASDCGVGAGTVQSIAREMERSSMTDSKWLSPRKLREYYIDHIVLDIQDAKKQLFLAVIFSRQLN
jgi:hypothetical protein